MNIIKSGRGSIWNPAGFFGFQFRISAFTAESITFCITAAMCIVTGYIDGSCGAFAVLIVGAVVCFAVDVNGFTSTTGISSICCRIFFLIAETFTGGIICVLGQFILNYAKSLGLDKDTSGSWCSLILILISVILTGLNLYSKIGKFGGAGGLVPITGFANSVAASAIEYKAEGQVFGIGCKIFTIAGPVILYGILSSWILGVIYYLFT